MYLIVFFFVPYCVLYMYYRCILNVCIWNPKIKKLEKKKKNFKLKLQKPEKAQLGTLAR